MIFNFPQLSFWAVTKSRRVEHDAVVSVTPFYFSLNKFGRIVEYPTNRLILKSRQFGVIPGPVNSHFRAIYVAHFGACRCRRERGPTGVTK